MNKEFMPKIKSIRTRQRLAKIKRYFTDKPEGNIWKRVAIYLILLRWLGPTAIVFIMFLMIGMAAPGADVSETINNSSQAIANIYEKAMTITFEAGQTIATNNPILSKVLFFLLGNVIWVFYAGMAYLIIDIIRYTISWIYNKKRRLSKPVHTIKKGHKGK